MGLRACLPCTYMKDMRRVDINVDMNHMSCFVIVFLSRDIDFECSATSKIASFS